MTDNRPAASTGALRVGIAIPSYLGTTLIARTLSSIQHQTYENWYCVVVNDGDEDGTAAVVAACNDPRIRYVADGKRRGQLGAFNKAILEVLGGDANIVRLLCNDDVLYPHNLGDMVRVFSNNPRVGLVSTHFDGINGDDQLIFRVDMTGRSDRIMDGREYLLKGVAVGNTIGGPSSVAIRREALESAGLFDTRLNYSGDSDLWHRVAAGWMIAWVGARAGYRYRFHAASVTVRDVASCGRFVDPIQVVRRVAATEPLFGGRWWIHQYTIGRLHAINVQLIIAALRRRNWDAARAGVVGSMREGVLVYLPLWLPRVVWQMAQMALGRPAVRRVFWRRVHESLQPPRVRVTPDER